jgi:hypothetical protein
MASTKKKNSVESVHEMTDAAPKSDELHADTGTLVEENDIDADVEEGSSGKGDEGRLTRYFHEMAQLDVLRQEEEFSTAKRIESLEIDLATFVVVARGDRLDRRRIQCLARGDAARVVAIGERSAQATDRGDTVARWSSNATLETNRVDGLSG